MDFSLVRRLGTGKVANHPLQFVRLADGSFGQRIGDVDDVGQPAVQVDLLLDVGLAQAV